MWAQREQAASGLGRIQLWGGLCLAQALAHKAASPAAHSTLPGLGGLPARATCASIDEHKRQQRHTGHYHSSCIRVVTIIGEKLPVVI